jgi:hypothetical protein
MQRVPCEIHLTQGYYELMPLTLQRHPLAGRCRVRMMIRPLPQGFVVQLILYCTL